MEYMDVLEPFDPEYLSDKSWECPEISASEKRFLRKVSIVENKLKREKIRFDWLEDEQMFRVQKFLPYSTYPSYMYIAIYMDENKYAFGGWTEDVIVDGKISVVVAEAKKWLNNMKPASR